MKPDFNSSIIFWFFNVKFSEMNCNKKNRAELESNTMMQKFNERNQEAMWN